MAMMTERALSVLIRSPMARVASLFTLIRERAKVPPSNSNTSETVVEYVQQDDIGQHDGEQDTHDFGKVEMLGLVDAVPGNVHHTIGQGGTDENTDTGNEKDGFERGGLGSYRRIQKVDCIVTDTDDEIEHGQHEQENDNA